MILELNLSEEQKNVLLQQREVHLSDNTIAYLYIENDIPKIRLEYKEEWLTAVNESIPGWIAGWQNS